jgi:hypothetical protein
VLCLLPEAGQLVDARILKVNKLGAYALIVDDGKIQEAMRILVPRDLHIGNEEFDALEVDQGIKVRLLSSRFQANDAFIQAVGTYEGISAVAQAATTHKKKEELLKPDVAATEPATAVQDENVTVIAARAALTEAVKAAQAKAPGPVPPGSVLPVIEEVTEGADADEEAEVEAEATAASEEAAAAAAAAEEADGE